MTETKKEEYEESERGKVVQHNAVNRGKRGKRKN